MEEIIRKNRPKISDSSLYTYKTMLGAFMRRIGKADLSVFKTESKNVLDALLLEPLSRRKTILSAIVAVLNDDDLSKPYKKQMMDDIHEDKKFLESQEKTDKQKKTWMSQDEVLKVYESLFKKYNKLASQESLSVLELQNLQDLLIASLYVLIPPRRLMDFTEFKLKNYSEDDNYMFGRKFIFNRYKTARSSGSQSVDIPNKLYLLLKKYSKVVPVDQDYLLFDKKGKKLTTTKLNLKLQKIFGEGRSVNQLRHTYISDNVLQDMPRLNELAKIANQMGHSVSTQLLYKK
jgi:integrase